MKTLSHLNILVSQMPIHILQSLQVGILHEIRLHADEANQEMTKVMDERAQLQQQYETSLQQKSEVEGKVEGVMKEKNEAEERAKKALKEKDEAEIMAQKTQATVQKLYKEILEVPIVVEDTMEEKVLKIGKVIKGF
jgi:phage shock protein A